MARLEKLEDLLTTPIQLSDTVLRLAREAGSFRSECIELTNKAERLASLLRGVARLDGGTGMPLYTRPLRRMLQELQETLGKALILVRKCSHKGMIRRVITITATHDFKRVNNFLENSLADLTWFLSISAIGDNRADGMGGMPPITSNEPLLAFCWGHIGVLYRGSDEERNDSVIALSGYAKDNEKFMERMVEEEAIPPLLKVLQDGTLEARETTARLLGLMAQGREDVVKQMVSCGIIPVSLKMLNFHNVPMRIQAAMAWAIAEMLQADPSQQDFFLEEKAVQPLVALLGESLEDLEKTKPPLNMHTLMTSMAASKATSAPPQQDHIVSRVPKPSSNSNGHFKGDTLSKSQVAPIRPGLLEAHRHMVGKPPDSGKGLTQRELNRRERENADPMLKAELKAEVARALWKLARGNPKACKSITETKALLCFATLMEKATGLVQLNSVKAVMEIAAVAENDVELRRAAFKMSSPAAKAIVDQLLRLVEQGSPELQVACIRAIGSLSRTFPVRETRVVKPLVKQLEASEDVVPEAVAALVKFASKENFLHKEHSKAIVDAGGASPLVQLIFFSKGEVQVNAVILMCNLALHSGESEALAKAEPLPALKAFVKTSHVAQPSLDTLVGNAINHLEIYHGRGAKDLSVDAYAYDQMYHGRGPRDFSVDSYAYEQF